MTDLKTCKEVVPGYVYHYKGRKDPEKDIMYFHLYDDRVMYYPIKEFIIIVKDGEKVGIILRHSIYDMHCVIKEEHRGKHIMSDFNRSGILKKLWPGNRKVELCGIYTWEEYAKKKHLVALAGLKVYNSEELEHRLAMFDEYPEYKERYMEWYERRRIGGQTHEREV